MYRLICSFFLLLIAKQGLTLQENYYWREYTGTIPNDAVVGGKDINGKDVYIGQAYVKNEGLIVVQIYSGVKEVYAPQKGIKKVDKYIKILCGHQENFYWMPATAANLHLQLMGKHPIIGGHEDGLGYYNVGRVNHQGEVKIGKINGFGAGNAVLFFNDNGMERSVQSYQVLMYDTNFTRFDDTAINIKTV